MSSPNPEWTVYSSSINTLIQVAEMLSVPVDKFLAREDIDRRRLVDAEARFPVISLFNLYESVALASDCVVIGGASNLVESTDVCA